MRRFVNRLLVYLLMCFSASTLHAAVSDAYLTWGHYSCPQDFAKTLETILSATTEADAERLQAQAVQIGHCTKGKGLVGPIGITDVVEFNGSNRKPYSCYKTLDNDGKVYATIYCSPSVFVRSITQDIGKRTGNFSMIEDSPRLVRATCAEGGEVMLGRANDLTQKATWNRASLVFPIDLTFSTEIFKDRDAAIRDGCKGVDYKKILNIK
jgi:hypothetical protein